MLLRIINFDGSWKYFLRPHLFPIWWYSLRILYNMQNIYAKYFDKNPPFNILEIL